MAKTALAALAAATSLLLGPHAVRAFAPDVEGAPDSAPASAPDPAQAAPAPEPKRIHVRVSAEPAERDALTRVLVELLQRVGVSVEVEPTEHADLAAVLAPEAVASAYFALAAIDLSSSEQATLYVHDPARDRVVQRSVERTPGD